jgi:hypothetical protein
MIVSPGDTMEEIFFSARSIRSTTAFHSAMKRSANPILALFALAVAITPLASRSQDTAPKSGSVTVSVGDVKVTPPGGTAAALAAGATVAVGSTITTGAGARAVIVMTPKSAIRIGENSTVVIEEVVESATPPKVTLDLKDGSLGALLKPGAGAEMDFKIKTPSGIAAARGTYYAVVVENGKGFAQVKEGKVEIIPAQP